jgi:nucleoid DNA-binding protein
MRRQHWIALGSLLGFLALFLGSTPAQQAPRINPPETLPQRLARLAKLKEEDAARFLHVLGPAVREDLSKGKSVSLPGLGTFRIVRVSAHRDLRNGRPVEIPAVNTVEFLADGALDVAANAESAVPAETVPEFKYIPLPTQTPGLKEPRNRVPPQRVP